jgi:hypothetical protein
LTSGRLQEAQAHLHAIARPRAAGSVEESDARGYCIAQLESHGFSVTEEPFEFSAAVGRWAVPIAGSVVFIALAGAASLVTAGANGRLLGVLLVSATVALAFGGWWASARGVLTIPFARLRSVNVHATRGTPDIWLMAHLDTKSQPIPSLVRAAAFVLMTGALVVVGVAGLFGQIDAYPRFYAMLALIGATGAVVLSLSGVGNESPGGADNATGLATLLLVAQRLPPGRSLGIVLTSAEELGLAGARAWAASRAPGRAINVDTVDDRGPVRCMMHGKPSRPLARALRSVAGQGPPGFAIGPLIPGILTDGVALAARGWSVVTLSRGTLATLGRIHRPSDSVSRLNGEGVDHLATLLVSYLEQEG